MNNTILSIQTPLEQLGSNVSSIVAMTPQEATKVCVEISKNVHDIKVKLGMVLTIMIIINICYFIYVVIKYFRMVNKK